MKCFPFLFLFFLGCNSETIKTEKTAEKNNHPNISTTLKTERKKIPELPAIIKETRDFCFVDLNNNQIDEVIYSSETHTYILSVIENKWQEIFKINKKFYERMSFLEKTEGWCGIKVNNIHLYNFNLDSNYYVKVRE